MTKEYTKHTGSCKCGECQGDQAAAEALFSSHKESGFSGYQGYADHHFKKVASTDAKIPQASRDKSGPNVHSEGRDAKQGAHGSPAPGTQTKGGIFRS